MKDNFVKRNGLVVFFILSFILSWLIWIPVLLQKLGVFQTGLFSVQSPIAMLGFLMPAIAAITVSLIFGGKLSLTILFRPLKSWKHHFKWYLIVLLFPAVNWCIARGIDIVLGNTYVLSNPMVTSSAGQGSTTMIAIFGLIMMLFTSLGEEIGWRGFALPRLQTKYNALTAAIIMGILWGAWHIPVWIIMGMNGFIMLVTVVSVSIFASWTYNSTRGSLLMAWIFHWTFAGTTFFLYPLPSLTDDIVSWVIAIVIVLVFGVKNLSRNEQKITIETYGGR